MTTQNIQGIEDEFLQEFVRFFHGRLEKELTLMNKGESLQCLKEPIISSQILLRSDDTEGVLVIKTDRQFLWLSHPERKYGEDLSEEDFLDWAGEIVNRILGGLKNNLMARGITTTLQAPQSKFGEFVAEFDEGHHEVAVMDIGNYDLAMEVTFALRRDIDKLRRGGKKQA